MADADTGETDLGSLQFEVYFPTFIYFRDFPDAAALNAGVEASIRAWQAEDSSGIQRSNAKRSGSWHSGLEMHRRPEFAELAGRIRATADEIFRTAGYDPAFEARIDNMWANVNPPGGYNRSHIHPNSLWSGVYYVRAAEGSGQIIFIDPRTQHLMLHPRFDSSKKRDAPHWTEVFYKPIIGRLILFPSWLYHEVEANLAEGASPDADRISVSFNLFQARRN